MNLSVALLINHSHMIHWIPPGCQKFPIKLTKQFFLMWDPTIAWAIIHGCIQFFSEICETYQLFCQIDPLV